MPEQLVGEFVACIERRLDAFHLDDTEDGAVSRLIAVVLGAHMRLDARREPVREVDGDLHAGPRAALGQDMAEPGEIVVAFIGTVGRFAPDVFAVIARA